MRFLLLLLLLSSREWKIIYFFFFNISSYQHSHFIFIIDANSNKLIWNVSCWDLWTMEKVRYDDEPNTERKSN